MIDAKYLVDLYRDLDKETEKLWELQGYVFSRQNGFVAMTTTPELLKKSKAFKTEHPEEFKLLHEHLIKLGIQKDLLSDILTTEDYQHYVDREKVLKSLTQIAIERGYTWDMFNEEIKTRMCKEANLTPEGLDSILKPLAQYDGEVHVDTNLERARQLWDTLKYQ